MFKWLAGIVGTVISGVLIWWITKSHEPHPQNPSGPGKVPHYGPVVPHRVGPPILRPTP
jgi:hypothetical protein